MLMQGVDYSVVYATHALSGYVAKCITFSSVNLMYEGVCIMVDISRA